MVDPFYNRNASVFQGFVQSLDDATIHQPSYLNILVSSVQYNYVKPYFEPTQLVNNLSMANNTRVWVVDGLLRLKYDSYPYEHKISWTQRLLLVAIYLV